MYRMMQFIIAILLFTYSIYAQQYADKPWDQRASYGIYGGLNLNQHTADFKNMPHAYSCCPGYESGSGMGVYISGMYALPLLTDWNLTLRFGYQSLDGKLKRNEAVYLDVPDHSTGNNGLIEHSIDAKISSIGLSPIMSYRLSNALQLHLGFRIGFIMTAKYVQLEQILEPSYGVFTDTKQRTRSKYDTLIPDASQIETALLVGLAWSLPLNSANTIFFEPETFISYGLMPVASGLSWHTYSLMGGVGIKFAPRTIIPPKPKALPPPPPLLPPLPNPPETPALDAIITAVSVEENGTESNVSNIVTEEFLSRKVHPLLNYVFFDENSNEIPARYKRMKEKEKKEFSENYLFQMNTLEVYWQMLNIVGRRMATFPQTQLTITGCNSNEGTEKNNLALSKSRAESVKSFLVKEWNLDETRIKTDARNLPSVPSNQNDPDGIQENRRVELSSDNPETFEPLIVRDTIRTSNPPKLRFKPKINSTMGIKSWKIVSSQQSIGDIKVFSGEGTPPPQIDWNLEEDRDKFQNEDFIYRLEVTDNGNQVLQSPIQKMPVKANTVQNKFMALMDGSILDDKEYDQFSFI